ncbi:MBL fold metallo-hydrolase [Bacteroidia bacterium]|nr:MBL fold metallo-hydrolase [Bacteroidia bacterium]
MKKIYLFILIACTAGCLQAQDDVITFALGDFTVSTLSEGQSEGNSRILLDATPDILQQYTTNGAFPMATNTFLIRTGKKNILLDAGYGKKLFQNLASLKVKPEEIDVILLTHTHGDHIGGLLRDGKVAFPKAELYISKAELEFLNKGKNEQAQKAIAPYKDKMKVFKPVEIGSTVNIFEGVQGIAAYGHTPGHVVYLLESGDDKLLIWGDLTHAMAVQMPHPEIAVSYDSNPQMAIKSRKQILEYVTKNKNIRIGGMHIAFPAIGKLKSNSKGGYEFNATCLCEGI